jgi:hypothetical protein
LGVVEMGISLGAGTGDAGAVGAVLATVIWLGKVGAIIG